MVNLLKFGFVNLLKFGFVNLLKFGFVNMLKFGLVNLLSFGVIKMSFVFFSSIVKVLIDVENISFHIALEANLG